MNGREKRQEPALAMICLSAKQEPPDQGRNTPPETHPPAEFPSRSSPTAIDARPLQSVAPKPHSNGNVVEEEKKREREHKKRSKNWTRIETTKLIRIRSDMEPRFCRAGRKSDLWDEISDLLRTEGVCRDPQQCRDKWEKLTAAYKEVREGIRDKEDFPFFSDLDPILSGRPHRRESLPPHHPPPPQDDTASDDDTEDAAPRKRRSRLPEGDRAVEVLKELMESAMAQQQRFMADLVEAMERRERFREKIRQEREERWREEDREQRLAFENAILVLAKRIGRDEEREEEKVKEKEKKKKRSRNWKRGEVVLLIKKRREMEGRFEKAARRGAVWEELAEQISAEGVKRDGKQCREKWDKLMAELKEVSEGKRDRRESPYFGELLGCGIGPVSLDNPTAGVD